MEFKTFRHVQSAGLLTFEEEITCAFLHNELKMFNKGVFVRFLVQSGVAV